MGQTADLPVANGIVARLRLVCLELPEVVEGAAWAGIRWTVRGRNFAHVLQIDGGWPPAYARAAGTAGPACVLTFRLGQDNCAATRFRRRPFFRPPWFANIAGMVIDAHTDWDEVDGLLKGSYCVLAPGKLAAMVE